MVQLKSDIEIDKIRMSCNLLSNLFEELKKIITEGISTIDIDTFVRSICKKLGAKPAFLDYDGFPAAICTSPNDIVIHGIPNNKKLKNGDILSLDCGLNYEGYFSDAAFTVPIGKISAENQKLLQVTQECLDLAIKNAVFGNRISDISNAVYNHAKQNGFGIVREYCGHGVGFSQHEDPQIPNYISTGPNPRLRAGMVLAIEPMINAGTGAIKEGADNWTVFTKDGKCSAHFEHTIAIFPDHTEVLTKW